MLKTLRYRALGIACWLGLVLTACERFESGSDSFVKTTYSDSTTEIIDHILLDLWKPDLFYEDLWMYQRRVKADMPAALDTAGQQVFLRRYLRERKRLFRSITLVVWPQLSSKSTAPARRSRMRENITGRFSAGSVTQHWFDSPRAQFDSTDNGLYHHLLDSLAGARLQVTEMKNTGRYVLVAPQYGPRGKLFTPPVDWESSRGDSMLVGTFAVSKAVIDRSGKRACFLFELYGDSRTSSASFVFVERRQGRWVFAKSLGFWQS